MRLGFNIKTRKSIHSAKDTRLWNQLLERDQNSGLFCNWVRIREKSNIYWFGLPELGTQVFDRLHDRKEVTTSERPYILCGPCGLFSTVTEQELIENYSLVQQNVEGSPITSRYLDQISVNGKIDWKAITQKQKDKGLWAFFPDPVKFGKQEVTDVYINTRNSGRLLINDSYVRIGHGIGDFLVASSNRELTGPDLQTIQVVNGIIFVNTYDMRQFRTLYKRAQSTIINTHEPKKSLINKVDTNIDRVENVKESVDRQLDDYISTLDRNYFKPELVRDIHQTQLVIQVINGYTLGFRIRFIGEGFNNAEIQYFEMKNGNLINKTQTSGTFQVSEFASFIDKKIKESGQV